jgi:hypothetical protein
MDNMVCWSTTNIQMCRYFIHCYASILLHDCFNRCNGLWCHYCAWPGQGQFVTELMPFMNFLFHSYAYCSDRHASPYWTFIRQWISMGFTLSLSCSSSVRVANRAAVFTLILRCHVAFLHHTATCQPFSKL